MEGEDLREVRILNCATVCAAIKLAPFSSPLQPPPPTHSAGIQWDLLQSNLRIVKPFPHPNPVHTYSEVGPIEPLVGVRQSLFLSKTIFFKNAHICIFIVVNIKMRGYKAMCILLYTFALLYILASICILF